MKLDGNHTRWASLWKSSSISGKVTCHNKSAFDEIKKHINLRGLNTLEVGCGTGSLSLLFSQVAKSVTLLGYTENSLKLAKELFEMRGISNCSFVQDDLFDLHHDKTYDLVISSGLFEHFKGKELLTCLNAHIYLAKKSGVVIIIAPSDTWFNETRCHDLDNIKLYGYWRPISKKKLRQLFKDVHLSHVLIKRFDCSYGLEPGVLAFAAETGYYKTNLYAKNPFLDNVRGMDSALVKKTVISFTLLLFKGDQA